MNGGLQITNPFANLFVQDPLSSQLSYQFEEFIAGTNVAGQIGEFGWRTAATSVLDGMNAGQAYFTCIANHPGIYRLQTTAVSNSSGAIILYPSGNAPICYDVGVKLKVIFRVNANTNSAFFVGFANDISVLSSGTLATRYFGLSVDTAAGDATFFAVCKNAGAVTKTNTGVAFDTNWHTAIIEVTATGANVTIDNAATIALPNTNFPTAGVGLLIAEQATRTTTIINADIDAMWLASMPVR